MRLLAGCIAVDDNSAACRISNVVGHWAHGNTHAAWHGQAKDALKLHALCERVRVRCKHGCVRCEGASVGVRVGEWMSVLSSVCMCAFVDDGCV